MHGWEVPGDGQGRGTLVAYSVPPSFIPHTTVSLREDNTPRRTPSVPRFTEKKLKLPGTM